MFTDCSRAIVNTLVKTYVAYVEGGERYSTLEEAVANAEDKATVKLHKNTNGNGIVVDKDITIDFDTNTYDIVGPAVGSAGTTTLGFQILKGNDVVLKNGKIIM